MLVSAVAMPLVGRLVDRFSLRWIIGTGVVLSAVGIGLMGRVAAPWQMFLVYGLVYALGNAGTSNPVVGVMISRWFVRRRGLATSAAVAGSAAGQLVIIALLASYVATLGWRTSYQVLGIVNLVVLAPLVLATVRSRPPAETPADLDRKPEAETTVAAGQGGPLKSIFASRQLWLLVAIYAICGFQDFFVVTHVVAFALDQDLGPVLAGNLLALMGLVGLAGVLSAGLLADAFGASRPTLVCFLLRIGIFALVLFYQDTPAIIAFALLYGFTFLITAPLTIVFAGKIFGPGNLGTASGFISMVHQIAGGLGAITGAIVFDIRGSYGAAFLLMLVLAIVATFLTILVKERPSRAWAPDSPMPSG
jgi:MFS family permease